MAIRPGSLFFAAVLALTACGVPSGKSISHRLTYFVDSEAQMDAARVRQRLNEFKQGDSNPPRLGFRKGNVWFHIRLDQKDFASDPEIYLQIEQISVSFLDMFQDGRRKHSTGTWANFQQRPVAHRTIVLPVRSPSRGPTEILIRVKSHSVIELPLLLWKPADFHDSALIGYAALGTFIGVILIMAAYNLILAITIREKSYYLYVLYTLSIGTFALQEDAILHHFFRTTTDYYVVTLAIIYGSVTGTGLLFARAAMNTRDFAPRLDKAMLYCGSISLLAIPAFMMDFSFPYRILYFNLMFLIALVLMVWAVAAGIRAGSREARIFALAFGIFFASAFSRLMFITGAFESSNILMRHGLKLGIVAELMILSLMLADRFNRLRDEYYSSRLRYAEERRDLIGEVHDSIGSRLSAALMQVREGGRKERIIDILRGALENARDITAILRLSDGPEQTFEKDARDTIAVFQGMRDFSIHLDFDPRLNVSASRIRVEAIRVFQEWLNNSVRHGRARNFEIVFAQRRSRLLLVIKSDGTPFAWNSSEDAPELSSMGSGLAGIRARCRRMDGRARSRGLKSGRGTIFVMRTQAIAAEDGEKNTASP